MSADVSPTPDELAAAPALAVLAVLDHTLDVAQRAVLAAHPELTEPSESEATQLAPMLSTAVQLLEQAQALRGAIARYCLATALQRR